MKKKNYKDSLVVLILIQSILFILEITFPDYILLTMSRIIVGVILFIFAVITLIKNEK